MERARCLKSFSFYLIGLRALLRSPNNFLFHTRIYPQIPKVNLMPAKKKPKFLYFQIYNNTTKQMNDHIIPEEQIVSVTYNNVNLTTVLTKNKMKLNYGGGNAKLVFERCKEVLDAYKIIEINPPCFFILDEVNEFLSFFIIHIQEVIITIHIRVHSKFPIYKVECPRISSISEYASHTPLFSPRTQKYKKMENKIR